MLPVVTFRHYTKYVVDYLAALLAVHNIPPDTKMNNTSFVVKVVIISHLKYLQTLHST